MTQRQRSNPAVLGRTSQEVEASQAVEPQSESSVSSVTKPRWWSNPPILAAIIGALAVITAAIIPVVFQRAVNTTPVKPAPVTPTVSLRDEGKTSTQERTKTLSNGFGMEFVLIPAGEFQMGSLSGDGDELPVHAVRISQPFELGKYEVTQAEWEAVMKDKERGNIRPSGFNGDPNLPVESVSWKDVQEFIMELNENEQERGWHYRLPTEAEWEYAARAGSTAAYSFGNDTKQLGEYAWYTENAGSTTHPVGQRRPNAWGLYDMHGNVWEWVQDWYGEYALGLVTDPQGPPTGTARVVRGGSWFNEARDCRSAYRISAVSGSRLLYLGFRVLRTARNT